MYIYCLLECFYVWVSSVSCRNVGVFPSAIWLVAREPTTLAVFYLHFWWGGLNFVSLRVVNSTVVFWLLLKITSHITRIFNKNVLFPVDVVPPFNSFSCLTLGVGRWPVDSGAAGGRGRSITHRALPRFLAGNTAAEGTQCPERMRPEFLAASVSTCFSVSGQSTWRSIRPPAVPKLCPPGFAR